jgi:hypothetical protein
MDAESRAIFDRRWARRRKLLPNLKLRYPNAEESKKLAKLAGIDDFDGGIQHVILDAHLNFPRYKGLSAAAVRKKLLGIARQAQNLSQELRSIDVGVGVGSGGSEERAGLLLELKLGKIELPELVDLFHMLGEAAQRAAPPVESRLGQKNYALDKLVSDLYFAAQIRGGEWTVFRATDRRLRGPLLDAVKILQKYLPKEMFPHGVVNERSIEYSYEKVLRHIKKHLTTKNLSP